MRVSLFITCVVDTLFPQTGQALVHVLERLGHQVELPLEQTCCGQMHVNSGYAEEALPLVERMIRIFERAEVIVSPSASCTALVREHYPELAARAGGAELAERARALAARTYEVSEFLVDLLGVEDVGASFPHRVTYHPSCHGLRMLDLGERPLRLLRAVRGIEIVDLPAAEECCGFGGTFAVKNADVSMAMLSDKLRHLSDTGAEVCVATDSSCLMHIDGALARQRRPMRTMHLAEILAATP